MRDFKRSGAFGRPGLIPPVLKALLIINVAIYLLQVFFLPGSVNSFIMNYLALWPINLDSMFDWGNFYPWQLISYQFLHSLDNFLHVGFNMFALWMFGTELEDMWGSSKFLAYYLLCGIGAGIFQLLIQPFFSDPAPAIGASGAVYGMLLAFGMTFPNRPIFMFPLFIPVPAKIFVIIFAAIELISGISGSDGIAHFAHLGGAFTGFILLKFGDRLGIYRFINKIFKSSRSVPSSSYVYQQPPVYKVNWQTGVEKKQEENKPSYSSSTFQVDGEEITQSKIDAILDKISATGYQNLSEREKKILFELSQKLK